MNVRNMGKAIKAARKKAAISQQKLSEGICSVLSLSRIENGTAGVSPATFHALMTRAGVPFECYPVFRNKNDFECFYNLKQARFSLNAYQLNNAYHMLEAAEQHSWEYNRLYYQEWLFLYGKLLLYSGYQNHAYMYQLFSSALSVTKSNLDFCNLKNQFLSVSEIEILIFLAQEKLSQKDLHTCHKLCKQVSSYLHDYPVSSHEIEFLEIQCNIVYIKLLIEKMFFASARTLAYRYYHKAIQKNCTEFLYELRFFIGFCDCCMGNTQSAVMHFQTICTSCCTTNTPFITVCQTYMEEHHFSGVFDFKKFRFQIDACHFPLKELTTDISFSSDTFNIYDPDVITVGSLIRMLRSTQKLSQGKLCRGLCSKSALSKIENGRLQPSVILLETLFQRLGYSENLFIFWGNAKDVEFHELEYHFKRQMYPPEKIQQQLLVNKLFSFVEKEGDLYHQYYLYQKSFLVDNNFEKTSLLKQAFQCTIKHLDRINLTDYRFSWVELMILSQLILCASDANAPYIAVQNFQKYLQYYDTIPGNIIFRSETYLVNFFFYFELLYKEKHYKTITDLFITHAKASEMNYNFIIYSMLYSYYARSLKEQSFGTAITSEINCARCLLDMSELELKI